MKPILIFVILLVFSAKATGQRGNNWVFGNKAIINFSTIPPSTGVSAMVQQEGSSSISDLSGNLLFYSDGVSLWNAYHQMMPNGTGLLSHFSSTQSAMIVPFPNDSKRYYVFTVDGGSIYSNDGLCYSVVNMELDNGKGDVELKNVRLIGPTSEKVTCVNHCNGKDVWVMTAVMNSDKFYAYLVTATGIQPPVISSLGVPSSYFSLGYLKFSPDGKKLACGNLQSGLDIFDFDAATGFVSNRKKILTGSIHSPYGIEFSPNSRALYVSDAVWYSQGFRYDISQYTQLDANEATIVSTRYELDFIQTSITMVGYALFSALQLGPDEQLYVSRGGPGIGIIKKPNRLASACEYTRLGMPLAAGTGCFFGLPDFNQSYFKGSFSYDVSCTTNEVNFYYTKPTDATFLQWDFGDPISGVNNTATVDSPLHVFSSPGTYTVQLIVGLSCRNDTMVKKVKVDPLFVNLGADTTICNDSLLLLNPQSGSNRTYLWQDNSTDSTLTASSAGLYWVEVTNPENGCKIRDSLVLGNKPNPSNNLGIDTFLCEKKTVLLDAGNPGAQFTWHDNSTNQTFLVKKPGSFSVKVNLDGCIAYDTINIRGEYFPRVYLGNDTAICEGMKIILKPFLNHAENASFLWSNGETTQSISITQPGTYSLELRNICGTVADGIVVRQGVCKLYMPTGFTPNNDGKNDILKPGYGENVTNFSIEIYNRWGERVFVSDKIYNGWDGKLKGVMQTAGTYVWFIRYKIINDTKEYIQKGTVALIY